MGVAAGAQRPPGGNSGFIGWFFQPKAPGTVFPRCLRRALKICQYLFFLVISFSAKARFVALRISRIGSRPVARGGGTCCEDRSLLLLVVVVVVVDSLLANHFVPFEGEGWRRLLTPQHQHH